MQKGYEEGGRGGRMGGEPGPDRRFAVGVGHALREPAAWTEGPAGRGRRPGGGPARAIDPAAAGEEEAG